MFIFLLSLFYCHSPIAPPLTHPPPPPLLPYHNLLYRHLHCYLLRDAMVSTLFFFYSPVSLYIRIDNVFSRNVAIICTSFYSTSPSSSAYYFTPFFFHPLLQHYPLFTHCCDIRPCHHCRICYHP